MNRSFIYLYLLLFVNLSFAQDSIPKFSSITLHKIYYFTDDGHCNVFLYPESGSYSKITVNKSDDIVRDLIKFKKSLSSKKSTKSCCHNFSIGCYSLENMISFQFNGIKDTLYFNYNEYEKIIVDYRNGLEYEDNDGEVLKIISKSEKLKDFFKTDLKKLYYDIFDNNLDSISSSKINFNNSNNSIESIKGVQVGDSEKKLVNLFPNSCYYLNEIKEFFKNKDLTYSILVNTDKENEMVEFILKDEVIIEIVN